MLKSNATLSLLNLHCASIKRNFFICSFSHAILRHSACDIGADGAWALSDTLMSENTTLKSLILTCLLIDHVDVSKCLPLLIFFFFDAILHSSLCLSSRNHAAANVLGDDGAFALVETVKVNTTLTTLDLSCLRHCFHCCGKRRTMQTQTTK